MLTILLVDAELELIPKEMLEDYSIIKLAKQRKKAAKEILLDSNFMHTAIDRYFPNASRRMGRPDIIYNFLQVALESILNKRGGLQVYIHTKKNKVLWFNPEVNLPKSYNRFVGLIEDLFKKNDIKSDGKTLITLRDETFEDLLRISTMGEIVVLSPTGEPRKVTDLFQDGADKTVIIGGFSEGDYVSPAYKISQSFRIFEQELTIWTTAMEMIAQYERDNNFL